ncbi:MAG: LysE family transporter [Alphaproteobacteria bacterium]|nr:LysE family transporter [Alphaproteobacteria bacterium]
MSEWLLPLASVAVANILGAMSPGPAFVLIARTAVTRGMGPAMAAILGLALGAMLWTAAAIWGLQAVFATLPWLQRALPFAGGLFLLYLAVMIWRHARDPAPTMESARMAARSGGGTFLHAFLIQVSNPKIMVFFGSIFMAVLPAQMPLWVELTILAMIFVNEFAWYGIVATVFASAPARAAYGRAKTWIDRAMAGLLGALGIRLLLPS